MKKYLVHEVNDNLYYLYEDKTVYAQTKEDRDLKFIALIKIDNRHHEFKDEEILAKITEYTRLDDSIIRIEH